MDAVMYVCQWDRPALLQILLDHGASATTITYVCPDHVSVQSAHSYATFHDGGVEQHCCHDSTEHCFCAWPYPLYASATATWRRSHGERQGTKSSSILLSPCVSIIAMNVCSISLPARGQTCFSLRSTGNQRWSWQRRKRLKSWLLVSTLISNPPDTPLTVHLIGPL